VRIRPGEELENKNLAPNFRSDRISVSCWAAIAYGRRTPLIRIRRRKPSERATPRDRLGLNSAQYATEIYDLYLIPFLFSLKFPIEEIPVLEDNLKVHTAGQNRVITSTYNVQKLPLPANSPDLNPIENAWHILKVRLRKRFTQNISERPTSENELWAIMEEEWDAINQETIDGLIESMVERVDAIVAVNGNHIKW